MKMNFIHIHFTDREAFRLKSDLFPGLAHPTQHYTKEDIRRLQDYAARYHIMLIPEIEMPAHASSYTDYNPYLAFDCASMRVGHKVTENFEASDQVDWKFTVDITRREVRSWLKAVLDEWVPLFDAPCFHIGGDEWQYDANKFACPELMEATRMAGYEYPGDLFVEFVNEMNEWVRSHGKTTHIWNWWRFSPDKGRVNEVRMNRTSIQPDKNIIVHVWNYPRQQEILDDGYEVIITSEEGPEALYSTPYKGDGKPGDYGVFQKQRIYEEWVPKTGSNILGYKVCLWTDTNDGRPDEWYEPFYHLPIAVLAEKTWGSTTESSLNKFKDKVYIIGVEP
jgi:hexosaminidase